MQQALAYVLNERRRMLDALRAMGYADAYELEPRGYRLQLERFARGLITTIGSESDPFVLMAASGRPVARYYIKAIKKRCMVVLTGSAEFMSTLSLIAQRDASVMLH